MVDGDGTTVLMTCSDEVDVKYADIVGYLRNGKISLDSSFISRLKKIKFLAHLHNIFLQVK